MHELLSPLVPSVVATTLAPGPNVVLVTASAANFGFRRTLPQMLGITLGFGSMIMAAGLGLAGLLHAPPRLHAVLKHAGAAHLVLSRLAHCASRRRSEDGGRQSRSAFSRSLPQCWRSPAWHR
jgi:threonine/homoserine/homoserine lactone efflux protein